MSFTGKVALITGGSKGIGKAVVQQLAAAGAKVVINYSSDATAADELVASIGADNAVAIKADAGSLAEIESLIKQTVDRFGKIDILVPNAGVMPMRNLESTTEEDFDKTYNLNVKGPFFLAQKAVPHMPSGSHIVFISTTLCTASFVQPPYLLYCSTKGAIEQMTRIVAKELAPKGINVNCVAPGPTSTELFLRGKPKPMLDTIAGFSPFNKLGTPEDIAEGILFLAGEGSKWVAGQTLRVNGGAV